MATGQIFEPGTGWRTFSGSDIPNSGVSAGSYGDATHVGAFTVAANGTITAASSVPISASSGVSSLDSITGAVTLVAGSNVTISDNSPSAGEITIAATGGGGGLGADGWNTISATLTFSSADAPTYVASTSADLSGTISVGSRVKLTDAGTQYFLVTAISATTLTLYGGSVGVLSGGAITGPAWSPVKVPHGFPASPASWTRQATNTSNVSQSSPTLGTWYNVGATALTVPIGVWTLSYVCSFGLDTSSADDIDAQASLSTSTSSVSDQDFTAYCRGGSNVSHIRTMANIAKTVTLASKTTYNLIFAALDGSISSLSVSGAQCTTRITAVSAYL